MAYILRLAVGIMGNAAALLLYSASIITFARVIKKKNTGEFSCIPYIIALLNCLLYTWYGLPVVSSRWENLPLVTINGVGVLLELSFIIIYFFFAPAKEKMKVMAMVISVILVFCVTAAMSCLTFHDHHHHHHHHHHHRKVFVGSIALVASVAMYASPLVAVKQVIRTKSVEFMPFYLSLFSFLASSLWLAYGLLGHDLFVAAPNFVGSPLGLLQLILYCKYRRPGIVEEATKWDPEFQNAEEIKPKQDIITDGKA